MPAAVEYADAPVRRYPVEDATAAVLAALLPFLERS